MLSTEAPFIIRKWTVKEYHKLGEMGFFSPRGTSRITFRKYHHNQCQRNC